MIVGKPYRAREFAELAGVTVRALHHYDRLGLLKPARTSVGYRVYCDRDLERLEQIVALKFIGIPLKKIKAVLDGNPVGLSHALLVQRIVLEEKRRLLDSAISAIGEAETLLEEGKNPNSSVLKKIIEVIEMQSDSDWMMKYFNDDAKPALQARRAVWTPDLQARAQRDWTDLFRDIEAALDEDPASEKAQALAVRWENLVRAFTGGDQQLVHGVKSIYADRSNWPADFREKMAPFSDQRIWNFFFRAIAARRGKVGTTSG